jgi:two-component system cell cycle sensor histidine kinase/response regulator CckA
MSAVRPPHRRPLRPWSRIGVAAVVVVAAAVLAGWLLGVDVFMVMPLDKGPMRVATALSLLLLGVAWFLLTTSASSHRRRWRRPAGLALAMAAGLVAVLGYAPGSESRLEQLMGRYQGGGAAVATANRIGPATAGALAALAVAAVASCAKRGVRLSQAAAAAAMAAGVLTLYGQVYLEPAPAPNLGLTATALHTSIAVIVLGFAYFVAEPGIGLAAVLSGPGAAAVLGRRLIIAAAVIPFALGWLRLIGQDHGLYGTATGTVLLVAANAAVFTAVGFSGAYTAGRLEASAERAERLLRERATLQTLMDNIPAAVFMKDHDGRYQLVNRAFERLTGRDRGAIVGAFDHQIFPTVVAEQIRTHDQAALDSDTPTQAEELLPTVDGNRRHYLTTRFPLADGGDGYAVCGVATDITGRVEAAAEREQLQRRLQQAERMETLSRLAGGIAHDFNNLLATIMGRAELIRDLRPGDDLDADVDAITRAAQRGAALTGQLTIFSHGQPGRPETVVLNDIVADTAHAIQAALPEHVRLVTRLAADLAATRIDPARIPQIIHALVDNALAAMPDGGRLTIETANATNDAPVATPDIPAGRYVRLTVTDTGIGMPPEVADRAFEPFFTTHGPGAATGLGLAGVYGIAHQAGGTVALWSRPNSGTMVQVFLPVATAPAETDMRADTAHAGHARVVLIVDDEDEVREVVRRILNRHGDLVMPGMSGAQLAQYLRQDRPHLPVLFMSGYTADTLPADVASTRIPLLPKPFEARALLARLDEILQASEPTGQPPTSRRG